MVNSNNSFYNYITTMAYIFRICVIMFRFYHSINNIETKIKYLFFYNTSRGAAVRVSRPEAVVLAASAVPPSSSAAASPSPSRTALPAASTASVVSVVYTGVVAAV